MGNDAGTPAPSKQGAAEAANQGALQFDKVELTAPASGATCSRCGRGLFHEYFALGGSMLCPNCAEELRGGASLGFVRALVLGGGAALLGTIAWFAIMKLTDREFGLLAIGVGLFVGFAVRKGSRALGGWKYQVLAMVLTYGSITASYVPLVVKGIAEAGQKDKDEEKGKDWDKQQMNGDAEKATAQATAAEAADAAKPHDTSPPSVGGLALGALLVFGIAFASPFLQGSSNFMGIIIIGIALYEAWKINRRVPITGPLRLGGAAPGTGSPPPGAPPPVLEGTGGP